MTAVTVKLKRSNTSSEQRTKIVSPASVKETDFILQDSYEPSGS